MCSDFADEGGVTDQVQTAVFDERELMVALPKQLDHFVEKVALQPRCCGVK